MKENNNTKKLYLIRRANGQILGPMLEAQVVRAFQDQRFDLRDEITGHCGPWVMFDDREAMTRYYSILDRYLGGFRQEVEQKSKKKKTISRPFMSRASEPKKKIAFMSYDRKARIRLLSLTLALVLVIWLATRI